MLNGLRGGLLAVGALLGMTAALHAETVKIGYIPVLGSAQLLVIDGEGWAKEDGITLELVRFQSGPQAVQALASGQLDAYVAGVLPLLIARSKGVDVKVIAAGAIEELQLVGRGPLAQATNADFKAAVADFTKAQGRRPKLAAQPQGSVPDTLLRYWLKVEQGIDPAAIDIAGIDIDAAQQAFIAGSVDGAVLREPALTVVRDRLPEARVIATGHDLMPGQPGSVLAIYKPEEPERAKLAEKLLRLHLRATELIRSKPEEAAPIILKALGGGILTQDVIERALKSSATTWVTDPAAIAEPVARLQDFQVELGVVKATAPVGDLLDTATYKRVAQ